MSFNQACGSIISSPTVVMGGGRKINMPGSRDATNKISLHLEKEICNCNHDKLILPPKISYLCLYYVALVIVLFFLNVIIFYNSSQFCFTLNKWFVVRLASLKNYLLIMQCVNILKYYKMFYWLCEHKMSLKNIKYILSEIQKNYNSKLFTSSVHICIFNIVSMQVL